MPSKLCTWPCRETAHFMLSSLAILRSCRHRMAIATYNRYANCPLESYNAPTTSNYVYTFKSHMSKLFDRLFFIPVEPTLAFAPETSTCLHHLPVLTDGIRLYSGVPGKKEYHCPFLFGILHVYFLQHCSVHAYRKCRFPRK